MDRLSQYIAFLILLTASSVAVGFDGGRAAEELRERFLESKFQPVSRQSDLPDILVDNFSGYGPNDIADIGEAYNPSDFLDGSLPGRQIVLAGIAFNHFIFPSEPRWRRHLPIYDLGREGIRNCSHVPILFRYDARRRC